MQVQEIKDYCMSKQGAYEECPFGDVPICYKLNGKIFAQLYPYEYDYKITLKCTEDAGQFYRMAYDTVFSKFSKKEQKRMLEEL